MSWRDRVAVVGVGDDGIDGLAPRARDVVEAAEVLCGGYRHLALFPDHRGEKVPVTANVERLVDRLEQEIGRRRVVVLASGDPCFYGIGPIVAHRLGYDRVEIIPNVGAVALAFARLGESWHDATVLSAHGRPLHEAIRPALDARKLAVLTDETNTPAAAARALLAAGMEDANAWVFEHLGGSREHCHVGRLSEMARGSYASLNVLIVLRPEASTRERSFGRPESAFRHRGGLITKAEVRAVSLSKLRPRPGGTLWDVGAGCGSVAIEAAGLLPGGQVHAIERSPEQIDLLRKNVADLDVDGRVVAVHGEAPAALEGLPAPDAVFVGGSGGHLLEILELAYGRLRASGRVVVNLATIERLADCTGWAAARGITTEVVQVQVSRGTDVRGLTRLDAQNPVWVVTLEGAP